MNNESLSYLAGIIDGEGTITLNGRGIHSTPQLQIANINIDLIDWIRTNFNGVVRLDTINNKWQRQTVYKWYCYGKEAIETIQKVFPWLIIKRKQSLIIFDWEILKLPPNNGTKEGHRNSISHEEKLRRVMLINEIRVLNKRGRKVNKV